MIKLCICHSKSKTLLVQYVLLVSSSTTIQGNVHLIGQHTDSLSFFPRTTPEQNSLPQDVTTQLNSSFVETRACSTLNLSTSLACVNEKLVSQLRKRRLDQELCRSGFIPGTVTEAGLVWPDTPKQLVNCIGTPIVQFPFSLQLMNSLSLSPTPFFLLSYNLQRTATHQIARSFRCLSKKNLHLVPRKGNGQRLRVRPRAIQIVQLTR